MPEGTTGRVTIVEMEFEDLTKQEQDDVINYLAREELAAQMFEETGDPDCLKVADEVFETLISNFVKKYGAKSDEHE